MSRSRSPRLARRGEPPTAIPAVVRDRWKILAPPSVAGLCDMTGRAHGRPHDFDMRAAPAKMIAQCFKHLAFAGMGVARQQRLGADDHAVEAIAALRSLLVDESLLYDVGMLAGAKTFERHDVAAGAAFDRDHAGARRDAVDQHRAG